MLFLKESPLIMFLRRGQGEKAAECARKEGASGATVIPGKGTASSSILSMLGIGDSSIDIVIVVTDADCAGKIVGSVSLIPRISGVSALLSNGDDMDRKWKMVNIIVNAGFSEDVMEAARGVGATGGTVVRARGTAIPGKDNTFLGVTVVPEKEFIMILAEADTAEKITDAVMSLECLSGPGVGVIFAQDVADFRQLGK